MRVKKYDQVLEALQMAVRENVYTLVHLPPSNAPDTGPVIVIEDTTIGIPATSAYDAFIAASYTFFQSLSSMFVDQRARFRVLNCGMVMLYVAPEHLTVVNSRKRYLLGVRNWTAQTYYFISTELIMLELFFKCNFRDARKSSTLWAYRRWLLARLPTVLPDVQSWKLGDACWMQREITDVILPMADSHLGNHRAWSHLRWLLLTRPILWKVYGKCPKNPYPYKNLPPGHECLIKNVLDWCQQHPYDTSGWSFLSWFLFCVDLQLDDPLLVALQHKQIADLATKIALDTKEITRYGDGDAIWTFLRTVYAFSPYLGESNDPYLRAALDREMVHWSTSKGELVEIQTRLTRWHWWAEVYSRKAMISLRQHMKV
jgi:hypothetical protein